MTVDHKAKTYLRAMRTRGFNDGLAGRECLLNDAAYRHAHKQGVKRREELGIGGTKTGS